VDPLPDTNDEVKKNVILPVLNARKSRETFDVVQKPRNLLTASNR
jgi:hypothetical protein